MEETYLVMDLRGNRYVPGLLTVDEAQVDWYDEKILQVFKDWESSASDSVRAVPLSFARDPGNRAWSVVDDSALLDTAGFRPERIAVDFLKRVFKEGVDADQKKAAAGKRKVAAPSARGGPEGKVQVIPSLFDEPRERLQKLLSRTLGPLLKTTLDYYSTVSRRLMLVDSGEIRDVLESQSRFGAYLEHNKIRVSVPLGFGALGGFALATRELHAECLPNEGATWVCQFEESEETRRYTWNGTRFTCQPVDRSRAAVGDMASHWESAEQLERVGAAVLALFWEDRLERLVSERVDFLKGQLEEDRLLLDRLRAAYERVSSEGFAEGVSRWIRAKTRR